MVFSVLRVEGSSAQECGSPYSDGCVHCRTHLTGDWFGQRSCLADRGITFEGDVTQYYQGVTHGGLRQRFLYGGHSDYVLNFDMNKLAGAEGLLLKVRGESQFGRFVNRDTGAILAENTSGLLPAPASQETALTEFTFTQFLSEDFAVFAGKLQTFDGDMNAFAHGRGKTQFMNVSFVANPIVFRTVPYSTYGAGFVVLRDMKPVFTFTALDAVDRSTTCNLDDVFEEGVVLNAELRLPTCFGGLPGHQLFGGVWSSRDVALLAQDSRLLLPPFGGPVQQVSDSWALYWNFDQYLVLDPCDSSKGWGVFGRAAIADDDSNPISWFVSCGIGGNSRIAGRESDTFGVGWAYTGTSDQLPAGILDDPGQSVELFYNAAVTPWFHVTADLQFVSPSASLVSDSVLFGLRAKIDL